MTLIAVVGNAHQVIQQAHVDARAAVSNASVADVESVAALNIAVFYLRIDKQAAPGASKLGPVKIVEDRRGCLSACICNLHRGTKTSLRHLVLAAKLRGRNRNLR